MFFLGPVPCVIQECLAALKSSWYWDLLLKNGFHVLVLLFDLSFFFMIINSVLVCKTVSSIFMAYVVSPCLLNDM